MHRIAAAIEGGITGAKTQRIAGGGGGATRVSRARHGRDQDRDLPVTRGVVHDPEPRQVSAAVEDEFGYAEMNIVSFEDLFGGKLHAAVDRQHPRDLYDVKLLYENEGLTDELFRTFLIYVASSPRPPHELLNPNLTNLDQPYAREFEGMTKETVDLAELLATRARLIGDIRSRLNDDAKRFLRTLHEGEPDFQAIERPQAAGLPAVRWKLINVNKLKTGNPKKHAAQGEELERPRLKMDR